MSLQSHGTQTSNLFIELIYGCSEAITILLIQYVTFKTGMTCELYSLCTEI